MRAPRRSYPSLIPWTLVFFLVLHSGCSVINPHVTWERPPVPQGQQPTLHDGINYANNAKDEYKAAIGEQAAFTNVSAIILIPLAAAALGMGVAQANGVSTAALGLSGAAGLGVATWLSSKPRQLVYAAGIKAMGCAMDAMLPLNFTPEERDDLKTDLDNLNDAKADVEGKVGDMKTLLDEVAKVAAEEADLKVTANETMETAQESIRKAESLLETAKETWAAGIKLYQELSRAGQVLMNAVDRIGAEVDAAINKTESDIQALPAIINGLAKSSAQFTKPSGPQTSPEQMPGKNEKAVLNKKLGLKKNAMKNAMKKLPEAEKQESETKMEAKSSPIENLINELEPLQESASEMSEAMRKVAAAVSRVSEGKPVSTLKHCTVDDVVTGITVHPAGPIQFEKGKQSTKHLVISGGKPPYTAELLEIQNELTLNQLSPQGSRVEIKASSTVPDGNYHLYVADAAGNDKEVTVSVVVKKAVGSDDAEQSLSDSEKKTIQQALCIDTNESFDGQKTRAAIRGFQRAKYPANITGKLTREQIDILLKDAPCPHERPNYNYYEKSLSEDQIKQIQRKLNVSQTGKLDEGTRKAIKEFQKKDKIEADGQLWPEVIKKIDEKKP